MSLENRNFCKHFVEIVELWCGGGWVRTLWRRHGFDESEHHRNISQKLVVKMH